MKRVLFILNVIMLLVVAGSGQQTLDVFKHELPEKILKNKRFSPEVEKNILEYGRLDPRIIYFYLEYLRVKFDKKTGDRENAFLWYLNDRVNETRRLRSKWLHKVLQEIKDLDLGENAKTKLLEYVQGLIRERFDMLPSRNRNDGQPPGYDVNRRDYMAYLYFTQSATEKYDAGKNYTRLADSLYRQEIGRFAGWYEKAREKQDIDRDKIKAAVSEMLYLFKGSYVSGLPTTPFGLPSFLSSTLIAPGDWLPFSDMLLPFFSPGGRQRSDLLISMQVPAINRMTVPGQTYTDTRGDSYDYTLSDDQTYAEFSVGLGYTLPLRRERGLFSYLRSFVRFSRKQFTSGEEKIFEEVSKFVYPDYWVKGAYYVQQKKSKYFIMTQLELSTPLFFLGDNLALEIGGLFHYSKARIPHRIFYDGTVKIYNPNAEVDPIYTESRPVDLEAGVSQFMAWPLISAKYSILDYMLINVDYIFNGEIQYGLGMRWPL
ncbi:MAG TPA: hypothetical protein ENJ15_01480 [Caldithrix abyssi]|uniref:Uncharacterized protein n=1 Tax=Caldithrix abyssi TaxID=187145 RepID=A0A7V5VE83_CALAY|nr:hypothetical protein [Caldithrix abyssi]